MSDNKKYIEKVFEYYRQHDRIRKMEFSFNVSITSHIDEIGGGRSSDISDQTANTAIRMADVVIESEKFVQTVRAAVNTLPELEQKVIRMRYMDPEADYITDYNVYNFKLHVSAPYYIKLRSRAFEKLLPIFKNNLKID